MQQKPPVKVAWRENIVDLVRGRPAGRGLICERKRKVRGGVQLGCEGKNDFVRYDLAPCCSTFSRFRCSRNGNNGGSRKAFTRPLSPR